MRPDRAPRDPRIDRAISWLIAVGFVGWSGLLWTRYDTLGEGQKQILSELAQVRQQMAVMETNVSALGQVMSQHKDLSFHPNADRIIYRQLEIVSALRERVDRIEARMLSPVQ